MNRLQNDKGGTAAKTKKSTFLASNPMMRKLNNVQEYSEDNAATYGGITGKTVFFLLFSVAGIILQIALSKMLAVGESFTLTIYKSFHVTMFPKEAIALVVAVIVGIVFQLLAFFVRKTTPVTGALYCVTQGYFISFLIFKVLAGKEYIGLLALAITMIIILVMALLYTKGIIKVNKKFKMVMLTLFITMITVSLLMIICAFIPFTAPLVQTIRNNFVVSIIFSVIFIIIAALFLICDFNTIDYVVTNKLPKHYEWQAAFGLSFTVLWLYLKVLDLILTIMGNSKN